MSECVLRTPACRGLRVGPSGGDARRCPHEGYIFDGTWSGLRKSGNVYGLCDGELRAPAIDDAHASSCLLG